MISYAEFLEKLYKIFLWEACVNIRYITNKVRHLWLSSLDNPKDRQDKKMYLS